MSEERDNGLIRFLLVAFPAGLILIGGLVVAVTHLIGDRAARDPNENLRLQAASLNRRPVNEEDLRSYLETLGEIGERHSARPDSLSTASYWLASTLGGANTGYVIEAQEYEWGEGRLRNLAAELPGRSRRSEIVVFGAAYDAGPVAEADGSDGTDGSGEGEGEAAAVLLAVARSLAGDTQGRSVRFVAYADGNVAAEGAEEDASSAQERYALRVRGRGDNVAAVLSLAEGAAPGDSATVRFRGNEAARFLVERAAGAFRQGSGLEVEVWKPEVPVDALMRSENGGDGTRGAEPGGEWGGRVPVIEVRGLRLAEGMASVPGENEAPGGFAYDLERLKAFAMGIEEAVRALASP